MAANPWTAKSYPPRILTPQQSIWLKDGAAIGLGYGELVVRRDGDACYISVSRPALRPSFVNGQQLTGEWQLNDGDFIHNGSQRFFFQQDPVADWHARTVPRMYPTALKKGLAKKVQLSGEQISFDGGKTALAWGYISTLNVEPKGGYVRISPVGMGASADTQLTKISRRDANHLLNWLATVTPFGLSVNCTDQYRKEYPDPYQFMADKMTRRIKSGQASIPVNLQFMRGEMLRTDRIRQGARQLGIGVVVAAVGIFITTATYSAARSGGGTYFIWYGPILFGCASALMGLVNLLRALAAPKDGG